MDNVSRFVAQIQANIRDFERKIKRAVATAQTLPDEIEVDVDADISKFRRGLLRAQALAQRFSARNIVKNVVVRFGNTRQRLRNLVTEIDDMNDNFQNELIRLAKMISAVGTVIGNVFRGALISSFSALIPIIAGVTSAVMALGNALGVTVGNVLAFVGALGIAGLGAAAYGGLVASVLQRYNDEAFQATEASQGFTKALDIIKSAWNGIVDQNIDSVFKGMEHAIYAARFALEAINPFINQVVESVRGMTYELKNFVQESPTMLRFFDNLNSKGTEVFENIIRGLGRFGQGLIDMVNASMPLIEWVAEGFNNLGTQFAEWANRMAETNGFHDFINYVQENMPKIGTIFGDFFLGVINLFAAFGENSSLVLDGLQDMMARFREWSETIKESDGFQKFIEYIQTNGPTVISLIGNIVMMIVNFAIAMAPIAQVVLEAVNAIIAWTSELFRTNPIVAQIIGLIIMLAGIFMMLVPSILIVTKVIIPLIATLVRFIATSTLVQMIVTLVRGAITLLSGALTLMTGPVGLVIAALVALGTAFMLLYENVEWFRNGVDAAWTFITNFITTQVQTIIGWFEFFRSEGNNIFISAMLAIVTTIAQGLVEAALAFTEWITEVLAKIAIWGIELAQSALTALAEFASNIAMKLIEAKNSFVEWISGVLADITIFGSELVSNIVSSLSEFVSNIGTNLSEAKNRFTTWVSETISEIIRFGSELVSNIISSMSEFVSGIASGTADALSEFGSFISEAISEIISFGSEMVSEIISAMADFVSEIISGGVNAVSEVATMGGNIVSEIGGFVGDMVSAGSDLIQGLIDGIVSMAGAAIDAATGVVSDAIAGAKNLLGINSPSRVFRDFGVYTIQGLVNGIDRMRSRAVQSVTDVADDMTSAFAPDLATTADIDSQIGNFDRQIRSTVDADIRSGIKTQRPQVNITVRNEGDVEMIRSYIHEEDAWEANDPGAIFKD